MRTTKHTSITIKRSRKKTQARTREELSIVELVETPLLDRIMRIVEEERRREQAEGINNAIYRAFEHSVTAI